MLDLKSFDLLTFLRIFVKFLKYSYFTNSETIRGLVTSCQCVKSTIAINSRFWRYFETFENFETHYSYRFKILEVF